MQICRGLMCLMKKKKGLLLDSWPLKIASFKSIICWMYLQNYQEAQSCSWKFCDEALMKKYFSPKVLIHWK